MYFIRSSYKKSVSYTNLLNVQIMSCNALSSRNSSVDIKQFVYNYLWQPNNLFSVTMQLSPMIRQRRKDDSISSVKRRENELGVLKLSVVPLTYRTTLQYHQEHITKVDEYTINYTVVGNGKHNILLLPGAMGTMQSDFAPQFSGLDKEKYTLISWDPIGYGKSRPPRREFIPDFYVNDAKVVGKLMEKLERRQYSIVGWSDGAITAIVLAALRPDNLRRAVLLAPMAYITKEDVQIYQGLKDISQWTPQLRQKLEAVYGAEYLETLWTSYCQYFEETLSQREGEVCRRFLPRVRCPALVLHGRQDPVVPLYHGEYVAGHITGAEFHVIEKGKHNFHYKFADQINAMIDEFLTRPEDLGATGIVNL